MCGRSREGAWIEISSLFHPRIKPAVAPARERGLKYKKTVELADANTSRSREGAWIEIERSIDEWLGAGRSLPRGSVD